MKTVSNKSVLALNNDNGQSVPFLFWVLYNKYVLIDNSQEYFFFREYLNEGSELCVNAWERLKKKILIINGQKYRIEQNNLGVWLTPFNN